MASPAMAPYHLQEHGAYALLRPVQSTLGEIELRLGQYVDRVKMTDETRATVRKASAAIAAAKAELDRLVAADRPSSASGA
jgi:hypothetical protein